MGYMLQCISIYSTNVAQESIEIGLIMLRAGQGDYLRMISSKINYLPPELLMDEKLQNKGTCKCSNETLLKKSDNFDCLHRFHYPLHFTSIT